MDHESPTPATEPDTTPDTGDLIDLTAPDPRGEPVGPGDRDWVEPAYVAVPVDPSRLRTEASMRQDPSRLRTDLPTETLSPDPERTTEGHA